MKETTLVIMQAMGYNVSPSLINAVIDAYGLAKEKGGQVNIDDIVKLKEGLGK